MKTAVITGASSGLGRAITDLLLDEKFNVHGWDILSPNPIDVTSKGSVDEAAFHVGLMTKKVDVLVNCAGVNQVMPIPDLDQYWFDRHMAVNARGILYTVQALLPLLQNGGTVCNIISNASHMPMRHSLAYNASKAAAAMITKQMARELFTSHGVTVFGVSPNRLKGTAMSDKVDAAVARVRGWSVEETKQRQREAMPTGEETDVNGVAEFVAFLLAEKDRHYQLHGSILDYGS